MVLRYVPVFEAALLLCVSDPPPKKYKKMIFLIRVIWGIFSCLGGS